MAAAVVNPIAIYEKRIGATPNDEGRPNDKDAVEREEYSDLIWNDAVYEAAIRPFLGRSETFQEEDAGNSNNDARQSEAQIERVCGGDIEATYARDSFSEADILFVSRDIRADGKLGSFRGFVCLKLRKNAFGNKDPQCVFIDLICNAGSKRLPNSEKIIASGKLLINAVKKWSSEHGFTKISLKAIESVISYYHYLGWRFIRNCNETESEKDTEIVAALLKAQNDQRKGKNEWVGQADPKLKEDNPKVTELLKKLVQWMPGFYSDAARSAAAASAISAARKGEDNNNDQWGTAVKHRESQRENGYAMLLCDDGTWGGGASKHSGGRRIKKKRKHRKKHQKKGTRKHRGGGKNNGSKSENKSKNKLSKTRRKKKRRFVKILNIVRNKTRKKKYHRSKIEKNAARRGVNIMQTIRQEPLKIVVETVNPGKILMNSRRKSGILMAT